MGFYWNLGWATRDALGSRPIDKGMKIQQEKSHGSNKPRSTRQALILSSTSPSRPSRKRM
jgi:hypothetical protein